jgi:hypothetical protein
VISEFFNESDYYHGTDSEGHWSEGSSDFVSYFKIEKSGKYRLLVHATGGSGTSGPARNEPLYLTVHSDSTISWYFAIPIILAFVSTIAGPVAKFSFEARRWKSVTEDEDDD